jgi:hypothetical protein
LLVVTLAEPRKTETAPRFCTRTRLRPLAGDAGNAVAPVPTLTAVEVSVPCVASDVGRGFVVETSVAVPSAPHVGLTRWKWKPPMSSVAMVAPAPGV